MIHTYSFTHDFSGKPVSIHPDGCLLFFAEDLTGYQHQSKA
jgi:hypothetical protein